MEGNMMDKILELIKDAYDDGYAEGEYGIGPDFNRYFWMDEINNILESKNDE